MCINFSVVESCYINVFSQIFAENITYFHSEKNMSMVQPVTNDAISDTECYYFVLLSDFAIFIKAITCNLR